MRTLVGHTRRLLLKGLTGDSENKSARWQHLQHNAVHTTVACREPWVVLVVFLRSRVTHLPDSSIDVSSGVLRIWKGFARPCTGQRRHCAWDGIWWAITAKWKQLDKCVWLISKTKSHHKRQRHSQHDLSFSLRRTGPDQIMIILTGQEKHPNQKESEDPKPLKDINSPRLPRLCSDFKSCQL